MLCSCSLHLHFVPPHTEAGWLRFLLAKASPFIYLPPYAQTVSLYIPPLTQILALVPVLHYLLFSPLGVAIVARASWIQYSRYGLLTLPYLQL
jgi:hypothetical protein